MILLPSAAKKLTKTKRLIFFTYNKQLKIKHYSKCSKILSSAKQQFHTLCLNQAVWKRTWGSLVCREAGVNGSLHQHFRWHSRHLRRFIICLLYEPIFKEQRFLFHNWWQCWWSSSPTRADHKFPRVFSHSTSRLKNETDECRPTWSP